MSDLKKLAKQAGFRSLKDAEGWFVDDCHFDEFAKWLEAQAMKALSRQEKDTKEG